MKKQKVTKFSPIAVVGASGLFPGSIGGQSFWRNILAGEDFMSDVPADHWLVDDYYDPEPGKAGKIYGNRGAFLPKVDFDPMQFGMPPKQLSTTDSAQLLGLIVASKVLEDAASVQFGKVDKADISVILGVASATEMVGQMASRIQRPHWIKALRDAGIPESKVVEVCDGIEATYPEWDESTFPGLLGNVVAGRITNRLDLGGTNCVVDAACASSLGAVSMAIRELQAGTSNLVITGGVDALNDTFMYMCFSQTPALSPTGDCRPFSADADGTMLGEGIGMVALRRLEDAERDGDRIYAVIRGIGSSSDGKSGSIYAPESRGQSLAIRRTYEMTDYDVDEVELVEAHGTATKAGDAAEFGGLQLAFEDAYAESIEGGKGGATQWCALGSVKSQIGHTKSAAGAASLFKVVMALHHKVLPPTIKVSKPNPALNIEESPFYLSTETRPWIHDPKSTRKGSVSSFGFGGSNFHVALEEYTAKNGARGRYHSSPVELLTFSAGTANDIVIAAKAVAEELKKCALPIVAVRLQREFVGSSQYRLSIVAENSQAAISHIEQAVTKISASTDEAFSMPNKIHFGVGSVQPKIGYLFPGQGSQYVSMGAELACEFDQARVAWDTASTVDLDSEYRLDQIVYPVPVFSNEARAEQADALTSTNWAQPAIGCVSASMLNLLDTLEVKADAVAGHSYGEVTALYAAGALASQENFIAVSRRRGELMKEAASSTSGSMTAVKSGRDEVQAYLDQWGFAVVIANINSPSQVVIAGETSEIEKAEARLKAEGVTFMRLGVATAFHTDIVSPSAEPFHEFLADIKVSKPRVPVYANTTASVYSTKPNEIRKTLAWQLANPVRFQETIEQMHEDGIRLFVEVGPSSLLAGMVKECLSGREFTVVSLDNKKQEGRSAFWNALGVLAAEGVALNFDALWEDFAAAEMLPESIDRSPVTIQLNGANHGKPYPPENGSAGVPKPNPEIAEPAIAASLSPAVQPNTQSGAQSIAPAAAGASTAVPAVNPAIQQSAEQFAAPVRDANWVAAFQSLQEQTLAAQKSFQQTLGDAHQAFLRASEVAFMQLSGVASTDAIAATVPTAVAVTAAPAIVPVHEASGAITASEPASAPVVNAVPVAAEIFDFEALLLAVVAEKTGYPVEMLTLDMELESGLGIDSIKRVEILSTLQEQIPHLGEMDTAELAELNTLGEIIDLANASAPAGAVATNSAASGMSVPANTVDFESMLLEVVAEKTGYPVEMLSLDMELESGLGIDSIKRVEILSSLQEQIPHLGEMDTAVLAELNTLGEIIELAAASAPAPEESTTPTTNTEAVDFEAMLLEVVADKTGYPVEMLTLDMELESGLGIDSIKRVEILSSLQEQIPHVGDMDTAELAELNTLGEIIDFVSGGSAASVKPPSAEAQQNATDTTASTNVIEMTRFEVRSEARPAIGIAIGQIQTATPVYLVGDRTGVAELLAEMLSNAGVSSQVVDIAPQDARWLVLLTGLNATLDASTQEHIDLNVEAFQQLRRCAAEMLTQGQLFVTVQATGGDFGLAGRSDVGFANAAWSTGIAAMAKTASREWPHVAVKAIDVETVSGKEVLSKERIAQELFAELIAGGPELEVGLQCDGSRITLVAQPGGTPTEPAELPENSVIVVSGGARGVTAACLQELLDRRVAKLAILGRTPLQDEPDGLAGLITDAELKKALLNNYTQASKKVTPIELNREVSQILNMREVRSNLARLSATGATVIYLPTDIANVASVEASITQAREQLGPINIIVHAAGVLADKEIHKKTDEQFQAVFQTKVRGLQNILNATAQDPLTHLVCFSSVAARTGNSGQVDYAMANEILNRVCQAEQASRGAGFCARSIGWGPWAGGMVDPGLAEHFRAQGVELIPLADGAELFADEIEGRNGDCVEIVYGGGLDSDQGRDHGKGDDENNDIKQMSIRVHVSQHPQVSSHLIQGQPVVPLTLVNEWGMNIAAALNPNVGIIGVRDLNVVKGIQLQAFESAGDWLVIDCRPGESGESLNMTVSDTQGQIHYKLSIQMGDEISVKDSLDTDDVLNLDEWEWTPTRIYEEFLFHGEKLQVVKKLLGVSEAGCRALLQMPESSNLARWRVAMLDGGLQLALLWERKRSGLASLPTKFGEMNWHAAAAKIEGPVTCELILKKATKLAATWSIVFTNVEKQIIATMEDVSVHVLAKASGTRTH